jgi:hypothetical protein
MGKPKITRTAATSRAGAGIAKVDQYDHDGGAPSSVHFCELR